MAALSCRYIHSRESSAEVEIPNTPRVMELFTTTDGTIAPVLGLRGIEALDPAVRKSLEEAFPGQDVTKLSWDLLNHQEKTAVIQTAARVNEHVFMGGNGRRTIPGLKYTETITVSFLQSTQFLGRLYRRGTYQIPAKDIFASTAIEFMGPNRMTSNLGFELHVRTSQPADQNYLTARGLQNALTGQNIAMHLHIVAPVTKTPQIRLTNAQVFQRMEFHRRVSLLFEMKMINRGIAMKKNYVVNADGTSDGVAWNFGEFSPGSVFSAGQRFFRGFNWELTASASEIVQVQRSGQMSPQTDFMISKSGTVGIRGGQAYDSKDVPLWGIEVRYLSPHADSKQDARDLANIQRRMLDEQYAMTEADARLFLDLSPQKYFELERAAENLWYYQEIGPKSLAQMDRVLSQKIPAWEKMTLDQKQIVIQKFMDNSYLYMLTHDWSRDPMFYNQPNKIVQIQTAQTIALNWIVNTDAKPTEVMKTFVKRSGLEHAIRSSMDAEN